jgi:hypothetical protein
LNNVNSESAGRLSQIPLSEAELNGIIALESSTGSMFNYNSQFTDIPGTSLNVTSVPKPFSVRTTETLEAYGIAEITDYPASATVFTDINLDLVAGEVPSLKWELGRRWIRMVL